jgi:hypothetical protein
MGTRGGFLTDGEDVMLMIMLGGWVAVTGFVLLFCVAAACGRRAEEATVVQALAEIGLPRGERRMGGERRRLARGGRRQSDRARIANSA